MRVAILSLEYPPWVMGGAGVYVARIAPRLTRAGHEMHVITVGNSPTYTHYEEERVQVHRLPVIGTLGAVSSFWANLPRYFSRIDAAVGGFDLVHNNNVSDLTLPRWLAPQPRLMTVHHLCATTVKLLRPALRARLGHPGGELGLGPAFERRCIRQADLLVAVSEYTASDLASTYGVDTSTISVVSHGACPEDYVFGLRELLDVRGRFQAVGATMLFAVGRLERRKGIDVLLHAFARLVQERPRGAGNGPLKLVIVGAGDQEPYHSLARSLKIEAEVVFAGRVDDLALRKLYAACDLFAFPSLMEGLGIVALEARAAGKYVVASRVGGIPEVVPPGAGTLVPPGDPAALAQAMGEALARPSRNGPPVPTWESAVSKLDDCYSKVVLLGGRKPLRAQGSSAGVGRKAQEYQGHCN